jgi:hypothetical protein
MKISWGVLVRPSAELAQPRPAWLAGIECLRNHTACRSHKFIDCARDYIHAVLARDRIDGLTLIRVTCIVVWPAVNSDGVIRHYGPAGPALSRLLQPLHLPRLALTAYTMSVPPSGANRELATTFSLPNTFCCYTKLGGAQVDTPAFVKDAFATADNGGGKSQIRVSSVLTFQRWDELNSVKPNQSNLWIIK